MATGLEIAGIGWAVTPVVSFMVNKTLAYLKKPLKRTYGIEADLEKLKQILPEIQSVVSGAETLKVVNPHQANLLCQMKEAVYDADDVMDEFSYRILEAEAAKEDNTTEQFALMALTTGKRFLGVDPLQSSLSKAIKGLERVKKTAETFMQVANFEKITADPGSNCGELHTTPYRETDRFRYSPVLGRDKERDMIINAMLDQASVISPPLVISVVGVGGIGKTTLAQLIYEDKKVRSVYSKKIWVRVGSDINEEVTKKILEHASSVPPNSELYTSKLQKSLSQDKFLLVLDDVWVNEEKYDQQENRNMWMTWIFGPLQECRVGSSILVTTRLKSVVEMVHSSIDVDLPELSWEHSKALFESHAFPPHIYGVTKKEELLEVGEKIIRKLNGSPLALKVVGGQLSNNHSLTEWTRVLESALSDKVTGILRLSYDNLPPHLKLCFAYCSLFPKGYVFSQSGVIQLIHMWIAQGFVAHKENGAGRSLEVIGRCCFDDLCSRSFFQPIESWGRTYFVMHDLINDLALSVSKGECCQIQNDQSYIPSTVLRHVSVSAVYFPNLRKIPRPERLRTLLVLNPSNKHVCIPISDEIIGSLRGARVLDFSGCCVEQLPETIEQMIHLRYLAFESTSMLLPETCSRLFHLQVIFMTGHRSKERYGRKCRKGLDSCAPKYMSSLSNLKHVYVQSTNPTEITSHCKIPEFHGGVVFTLNQGSKLEDIQDIGFQGSLVIRELENAESPQDALKAKVSRNEHMKELKLEWSSSAGGSRNNDNDVLEALLPPSKLSSLTVLGYRGLKSPFWLENGYLTNLSYLCLRNCSELRELPPLGNLPKLENIIIDGLNEVKRIRTEFYGISGIKGFPSLRRLVLRNMQNLAEWSVPEYRPLFPLLKYVIIYGCPKLSTIPNIHTDTSECLYAVTGEEFKFQYVLGVDCCESEKSYYSLLEKQGKEGVLIWKVTDGSGLKYASGYLLDEVEKHKLDFLDFHSHAEAVKDLYLSHCKVPLPKDGFTKLSSLERLTIEMSIEYLSFEGHEEEHNDVDFLPKSLKSLTIRDCCAAPNFLFSCFRSLSSLVQLEINRIKGVQIIDLHWLTSLTELRIMDCKNLKEVKGFEALTCLTTMEISGWPRTILTERLAGFLKSFSSLSTLKISTSRIDWFEDWTNILDMQHFRGLVILHITNCNWYPLELINCNALTSLMELVIDHCPKLIIAPAELSFLKSLNKLELKLNDWVPRHPNFFSPIKPRNEIDAKEGQGQDELAVWPGVLNNSPYPLKEQELKLNNGTPSLYAELYSFTTGQPNGSDESTKRTKVRSKGQRKKNNLKMNQTNIKGSWIDQWIQREYVSEDTLPENYTMDQIDLVRRSWVQFFLEEVNHQQSQEVSIGAEEDEEVDSNEGKETRCEDKAENINSNCSINKIANGTGHLLVDRAMLPGSLLQPECAKPSCQPSRLEKSGQSDASVTLMREDLKGIEFDRLGHDGLSLREWIIANWTRKSMLEFHADHDLFGGDNKIVITYGDIKDLTKMSWLNVSVIQLYMMKLYNICRKENIQNISFLDPARVNATQLRSEEQIAITYMAEAMQSRRIILAPYFEDHHWVLLVIKPSNGTVYVLDSLSSKRIKKYVIMGALTRVFSQNMPYPRTSFWRTHPSPQQIGGVECGYYVMNLMRDIITTNSQFSEGSLPENYTEDQIDLVRQSWVQFFLEEVNHQQSQEVSIGVEEDEEGPLCNKFVDLLENTNDVEETEGEDEAEKRNGGHSDIDNTSDLKEAKQKTESEETERSQNEELRRDTELAIIESRKDLNIHGNDGNHEQSQEVSIGAEEDQEGDRLDLCESLKDLDIDGNGRASSSEYIPDF